MNEDIHKKGKKVYSYPHKEEEWPKALGLTVEQYEKIAAMVAYCFEHTELTEEQKKVFNAPKNADGKHSLTIEKIFNYVQPESLEEAFFMGVQYGIEVEMHHIKMSLHNAIEEVTKSMGETKFKEIFGDRKKEDDKKVVN